MIILVAALFFHCPQTTLENRTNESWNTRDFSSLATAKNSCQRIYINKPCVKLFIKKAKTDYNAICGDKNGSH